MFLKYLHSVGLKKVTIINIMKLIFEKNVCCKSIKYLTEIDFKKLKKMKIKHHLVLPNCSIVMLKTRHAILACRLASNNNKFKHCELIIIHKILHQKTSRFVRESITKENR